MDRRRPRVLRNRLAAHHLTSSDPETFIPLLASVSEMGLIVERSRSLLLLLISLMSAVQVEASYLAVHVGGRRLHAPQLPTDETPSL